MAVYKFCMNSAQRSGETRYPQAVIWDTFPKDSVKRYEAIPVFDCWIFESDFEPQTMPGFIAKFSGQDPAFSEDRK